MDCSGIKKFLTTCCSCRSSDSSATDEVQITKISKISATGSVHSLLTSANGDHTDKKKIPANGTDNRAYQEDELETKQPVQIPPEKIINEQPKLRPGARCERQVSQLSDISDFAPVSDKGLAEMVLEDLEKSFSQDKTLRELQKSLRDDEGQPVEIPEVGEENETPEIDDADPETELDGKTEVTKQPERKQMEWRNKLLEDLNNDEDFELSSSEEEEEENQFNHQTTQEPDSEENETKRAKVEDDPETVNENTKCPPKILRNSSASSNVKCGGIPVVVDAGSYEIRAGLAGQYSPAHNFRNVVGSWRPQVGEVYRETLGEHIFAEDALAKHNALSLKYPILDGRIEDWKDFQNILDYTLCQRLNVDVKDHPLLITEPTDVSKRQREKQLEVVMEALYCPMTLFKSQAVLSTLTAGSDVTLVVSSGHGYTEVVPVYHGYAIQHAVQRINIGGRHITEYLARLILKERGINFSSVSDLLILDAMKQRYAEIKTEDAFQTEAWSNMIQHELPDGGIVELGAEIYKCTEPIFRPELLGDSDGRGLVDMIQQSVKSVDAEIRPELKSSVLLSGGNCALKGFRRQLTEKLVDDAKPKKSKGGKQKSWRVTCCQDFTNSTWIGGSVYAGSIGFRDECITDDDYFECGASILHRKCL